MSARSEWLQFYRLCRVAETESEMLYCCNPRYRDEFSKYIFGSSGDLLAWRAEWTTAHRMDWFKRKLEFIRLKERRK